MYFHTCAGGCSGSAGGYPTLYHFAAAHLGTYSAAGGCFWLCRWLSHLTILQQRTRARIVQLVAVVDLQVLIPPCIILQQHTWALCSWWLL